VHDNLLNQTTAALPLPEMQVIALEGPDAPAFAQAQFANDLRPLTIGHWQWNGWLTPKGRVIALFALLRSEEHRLHLVLPDGRASDLAAALQRYVLRRKLVIRVETDLQAWGRWRAPAQAAGATIGTTANGIELDYGGAQLPRSLWLAHRPPTDAIAQTDPAWRQADLRLGLPRLPPEQCSQWTPQQLGLERLQAYSVHKGCYPGQEIVARTHFLGRAKRTARLFETTAGQAAAGQDVHCGEAEAGRVVCVAGALALAVTSLDAPEQGPWRIGEQPAQPQPFLDGLAR
jgi:folate-binding protein YgfZ